MRLLLLSALALVRPASLQARQADLIVTGDRVWTGDTGSAAATSVAIAGDRIVAVGTAAAVARHRGPATRVLQLPGGFLAPGFIDNHTHFGQAGALLLGVNLLDVADGAALIRKVREARDRLPAGAWLVGGDWGAYEAWGQGSTGQAAAGAPRPATPAAWSPSRELIDSITPDTPALLSKWDRSAYLANRRALEVARADCAWEGVECRDGQPTGRLSPAAADRIRRVMPPKPLAQRLAEARIALAELARHGVTTIHDNTSPEQLEVYQELRRRGELTTRVYARPTLDRVEALRALGLGPGFGDDWIRLGGLKGFVDGIMGNSSARFYQPYRTSGLLGSWRPMMVPAGNMERLLMIADSAGWWPQVHAIGDHAVDTLLAMYERVMRVNGARPRRFRVIHAQVLIGPEAAERIARLGVLAEVQPYHAIDDMRWMEERIGVRARWAYAFRTLERAGVRLSFGSDWPGTNASWYTSNPLLGIYAAVTRQTQDGKPAAGWFPEERVSLETALRAYTVHNAWAEGAEDRKGRLAPGYLADLVVLDRDPFSGTLAQVKDRSVILTVAGGRVVYQR